MNKITKYFKHLKTISIHKGFVMKFCFKCGIYKRGLMHDLSKFGPTEFFSSARYFQGNSFPIDAEKEATGYSIAWQHHKGHNPHHGEYWIDNLGAYKNDPIRIPYVYVIEMVCDGLGAGIAYSGQKPKYDEPYSEPLEFFEKKKNTMILHEETLFYIEYYLRVLYVSGINEFCSQAKDRKTYNNYCGTKEYVEKLRNEGAKNEEDN